MQPIHHDKTTFQNNTISGNAIAVLGSVHGDVHFPGAPSPNQCLRDLRVTDPREDRVRIEQGKDKLLKDCYSWILDDPSFRRWRTHDDSKLLWISGDPGKGKTMMLMGLIDELSRGDEAVSMSRMSKMLSKFKRGSRRIVLSYSFCQSARPELNNAASVLRGLIYLLVSQKEDLMPHIQKRYDVAGSKLFEGDNSIYALREILSDILNDLPLPTYLLVDALDECVTGLADLLRIITDYNLTQRSNIKWLVTSRNLPEIERFLYPNTSRININLELCSSYVSRAVTAFIGLKVNYLATRQKYDSNTSREVQELLQEKAEGTFL